MDVSLRLRLVNQLSRPAEEAERDLKALQKTAEQLGRAKGGDGLARGLADVGQKAEAAKSKINAVEQEADQLRKAIGRAGSGFDGFKADAGKADVALARIKDKADNTRLAIARIGDGFGNFKADAQNAEAGLKGIDQQSAVTKAAIGRIGDGAFTNLKSDAASAEAAIRQIGAAADATDARLKGLRAPISGGAAPGAPYRAGVPHAPVSGGIMSSVEGAVDQFGVPVAISAGGAYLVGAVPAAAIVAGGAAVKAAAGDEKRSDDLMVTGEYGEKKQAGYDRQLGLIGARYGIGTQKAQETFGTLLSNGSGADDAMSMVDDIVKVGKATNADPVDIAGTAFYLQSIMGIKPDEMSGNYNALAIGSKEGKFEMRDMAAHGPSLFAAMANQGSTGASGVRLTSSMIQSIAGVSGTNDKAATSFEAMLNDMVSPDVADRFEKEYGTNIYDLRKKAIEEGKDPVLESIRAYHEAVGGDEQKTRSLFRNSEAYKGYAAVFGDLDLIIERMDRMKNGGGTIDKDFDTSTDNFSSQMDRLSSNVALKIKNLVAPALPWMTGIMRSASEIMEPLTEKQKAEQKAYQESIEAYYGGVTANPDDQVGNAKRWLAMVNSVPGRSPEQQHGGLSPTERDEQGEGRVAGWKKFLFGRAAEPDFSLRDTLGLNLRGSAEQAMGGYNEALTAEGEKATAEAQRIADQMKATLNFTAQPTIAPTFISPGAAPAASAPAGGAPGKQSSLQTNTGVKLTQNISSPNSRVAAVRAQREANRSVRMAQSRALGDIGPRTA